MTNWIRAINFSFQIWGSILSLAIMLCLFLFKRTKKEGEKLYLAMLACNMFVMMMDAIALIFRGHMGTLEWICVRACNYLQFFIGYILSYLFVLYLKEYIETTFNIKVSKIYTEVCAAFLIVSECFLTINLFYPYLYVIDEQNLYSRLPLYPCMYITTFAFLYMALSLLFKHWKHLKKATAISFLIYALIPGVSLIGSILFYGITFSYIGTTIALTVLFLYLQFDREERLIEKNATNQVEQLRDYEIIMNESIKISMQAEDPDENINTMLRYLGEKLGGDRIYIFEKNENHEDSNTYEWCAKGFCPQMDRLQNIPPEVCEQLYEEMRKKDVVILKNFDEAMVNHPFFTKNKGKEAVDMVVLFPIWNQQRIIGFFGINNPPGSVLDMPKDFFEIIANFLVSTFKKRDLIRQLQALSYTDVATGAQNRLAMYHHFETLKHTKHIGVMFCDITGLKETNDTRGHAAGDELIRNTYGCIKKFFDFSNAFRIGGDEFVVLCSGLSKTEFEKKIDALREALKEKEIVVAIGVEWRTWVAETVNQTLVTAEHRMYEEKNNWYISQGKERRDKNHFPA